MIVLPRLPAWRERPWRFFFVVLLLVLALGGVERCAFARWVPGLGAQWIWAHGDYRSGQPIAFYAVREVEVGVAASARIAIVADETYVLYVNGMRLGAGSYRRAAPVDEYEAGAFLQAGVNRILVELRSSRGAGGLLAEIELGEASGSSRSRVVTDSSWRIFRRYDRGLVGGWSWPENGEPPKIWQRSPTGRWRPGRDRARRPIPFQGASPPERRLPWRMRQQHHTSWVELDRQRRRLPALGPHQLYDWGEEVEGYLGFDLTSAAGRPGLLYFGSEPPDPRTRPPDEVLLAVPGQRYWEDAYPRRFRYVLIVGAEPYRQMVVELVSAQLARQLAPPATNHDGVFGLRPPRSYAKVEEMVWKGLRRRGREESAQSGSIGSNVSTSSSAPSAKR